MKFLFMPSLKFFKIQFFLYLCSFHEMCLVHSFKSWPGISVVIATDYWLDVPGSNPGGNEIFRPSIPAMGLTQPPVKWVPGIK